MTVTIVDYGMGNVGSIANMLKKVGVASQLTADPDRIATADRLILPGVGAFDTAMERLEADGLAAALRERARDHEVPLLGICLGMQMLGGVSEEFGTHPGLGLIEGRVVAVPAATVDGKPQKIPHIGWTGLTPSVGADWAGSILETTAPGSSVYLVHSYHLVPDDPSHLLADCHYGGHRITASVRRGNIYGCQFHPEKSGPAGLAILSEFLRH